MHHVEETANVTVDADALWRLVGSFQGIAEWHPMLSRVQGEGEQPGAIRRAIAEDGSEQVERLQEMEPAHRRYRYSMESSPMPVSDYRAEMQVQPKDDGKSTIRWMADFDTTDGNPTETVEMVRGFLAAGVQSLRERYAR